MRLGPCRAVLSPDALESIDLEYSAEGEPEHRQTGPRAGGFIDLRVGEQVTTASLAW